MGFGIDRDGNPLVVPEEGMDVLAARYLRIPYTDFEARPDKQYLRRIAAAVSTAEHEASKPRD